MVVLICSFMLLNVDNDRIESPLHTVNFLDDIHQILESKFTAATEEECMDSAGRLLSRSLIFTFYSHALLS